jgi:hypothetical protein
MRALVIALGVSLVGGTASAQTPYIAVYFDQHLTQETTVCPGVGVIGTWYVAARNFNTMLSGAEFAIQYPAAVTLLEDTNTPPVTIGNTASGISMGFPVAQKGGYPVLLCTPQVIWNCDSCVDLYVNSTVKIVANPHTGFLGCTDYPWFNLIPCVGLTAYVCPTVALEETTWGGIKLLYE